jgi:hypothetical protein
VVEMVVVVLVVVVVAVIMVVVVLVALVVVGIIIIIQFNSFIYVLDNSQIRPITAKHKNNSAG